MSRTSDLIRGGAAFILPFLPLLLFVHVRPAVAQTEQATVSALVDSAKGMLERGGDPDAPVLLLMKAVTLAPQNPNTHYWLARAYEQAARGALGRQNEASAKAEYETVIKLDPSHPDAYYRLGMLLKNVWADHAGALEMFRVQQSAAPGNREARFELLRGLVEDGELSEAVRVGEEALRRDPADPSSYPWLAGAYWRSGDAERAMDVFTRYFKVADEKEQSLYRDMTLVLTPEEQERYDRLDDAGKRAWWDNYWRARDPDPRTEVNERLLEHYIRVAYARIEFGAVVWPWDRRGDFYVRYGEPDMRSGPGMPVAWTLVDDDPEVRRKQRAFNREMGLSSAFTATSPFDNPIFDPPVGVPRYVVVEIADAIMAGIEPGVENSIGMTPEQVWASASELATQREERNVAAGSPERWVYLDEGIDVRFDDPVHNRRYQVEGERSRLLVQQMEERAPTISEEEERIERIDPMDSITTFRGQGGATRVTYAYALLPDEFGAFRSVTGAVATLDVEVDLYTPDWIPVDEAGWRSRRLRTNAQVTVRGTPLFVDAATMEVPAGAYLLTTLLMDPVSGRRAVVQEDLTLPDYTGTELMMSDVLPAALVREADDGSNPAFVRGDLEVVPLPGRVLQSDQPLYIYYELYNLKRDPIGATEYTVEYSVGEAAEEQALATRLYQGLKSLVGRGQKRAVLSNTQTATGISQEVHNWLEIDMSALPPGTYDLTLTVTDGVGGSQVVGRLLFRTLPPVPGRRAR